LDLASDLLRAAKLPTFGPIRTTVKEHNNEISKFELGTINMKKTKWVDGSVIQAEALLS
jgi:hypothetical protein